VFIASELLKIAAQNEAAVISTHRRIQPETGVIEILEGVGWLKVPTARLRQFGPQLDADFKASKNSSIKNWSQRMQSRPRSHISQDLIA